MSEELKGVLSYGGQRGPQGPKGDRGDGIYVKASIEECTEPGDAYFDEQGAMHILVELPDTWEVTVPIQGPTGETGEAGAMGPTGDCGVYVGTTQPTDPDVYVWINPFGSESSLIGPTGPTGPTGATGTGVSELSDTEGAYYFDGEVFDYTFTVTDSDWSETGIKYIANIPYIVTNWDKLHTGMPFTVEINYNQGSTITLTSPLVVLEQQLPPESVLGSQNQSNPWTPATTDFGSLFIKQDWSQHGVFELWVDTNTVTSIESVTVSSLIKTYSWNSLTSKRMLIGMDETTTGPFTKGTYSWSAPITYRDKISNCLPEYVKHMYYTITVNYTTTNGATTITSELTPAKIWMYQGSVGYIKFEIEETPFWGTITISSTNGGNVSLTDSFAGEDVLGINSFRIQGFYAPEVKAIL